MLTKFKKPALKALSLFAALAILQGYLIFLPQKTGAQVVQATGDFALNATNQGAIAPNYENYIQLDWASAGTGYSYVIKQSDDGGLNYETRSSNYGNTIKVLNIYPNKDGVNGRWLKEWMGSGPTDPGQGKILVDEVHFQTFKSDAAGYLKKFAADYYYDVIMFGSSDNNSSEGTVNAGVIAELQKFADTGRGILFGHDVAITNYENNTAWPLNIGRFARNLLGMSTLFALPVNVGTPPKPEAPTTGPTASQKLYGTKVKAIRDGFLLQYPWKLSTSAVYDVTLSHTTFQHAGATAPGVPHNTIWMEYANPSSQSGGLLGSPISPIIWSDGSTDNFYLVTYNNAAMIQTGHKTGSASSDERKILANTLMYLAQYSTQTQAADRSAIDTAAPNLPTAQRTAGNAGRNVDISSQDNGTDYWFKIVATHLGSNTEKTSNTVSETVKTMVKGYYISEDDNINGTPVVLRHPDTGAIITPPTLAGTDGATVSYTVGNLGKYVHIQAVDNAGNLGPVKTVPPVKIDIAIDAGDAKIYKPSIPGMSAKITTSPAVQVASVQYIMVPVADTANYNTEAAFTAQMAAILNPDYKGPMHEVGNSTGVYTMFSADDTTLNGVKDNCTVWIMAKGTLNGAGVTSFAKHTFTNIYTPINLYTTGSFNADDEEMYGTRRVGGIGTKYGVQMDLGGTAPLPLASQALESVEIKPEIVTELYTTSPAQYSLLLDDILKNGLNQDFIYTKDTNFWFDTTFTFVDDLGASLSIPDETVADFAPCDSNGDGVPFSSPYSPPVVLNYTPIGYIINATSPFNPAELVPAAFPGGFANVTIPNQSALVTIVYKQGVVKVTEKYRAFTDATTQTVPPKNIFPDNVTGIDNGLAFTVPPVQEKAGYVYTGYEVISGGAVVASGGMDRLNPVAGTAPAPTWAGFAALLADAEILYHYEEDTTNTGVPDSLQRRLDITGVGIDSLGGRTTIYTELLTVPYNQLYTPAPKGGADAFGNPTVFVDGSGTHWILAGIDMNDPAPITVTDDTGLTYFYYKDTGPTGKGDFFEANVKVEFYKEDGSACTELLPYLITEATSVDAFKLSAPPIIGFAPLRVTVEKMGSLESFPQSTKMPITGEIAQLSDKDWLMCFYYGIDTNGNGLPDSVEAKIVVERVFQYTDGFEETTADIEFLGRDGEKLTIDPAYYNKSDAMFSFVGQSGAKEITFTHAGGAKVVRLVYKQKSTTVPPPPSSSTGGGGGGGGQVTPPPAPDPAPSSSSRASSATSRRPVSSTGSSSSRSAGTFSSSASSRTSASSATVGTSSGAANSGAPSAVSDPNFTTTSGGQVYANTVETPFAQENVRYLSPIPQEKVPQGFVQVQKTDENGLAYWILEKEAVPLANRIKNAFSGAILPLLVLLAALLFALFVLLKRRFKLAVQEVPGGLKLSWTKLGNNYRYIIYKSADGGATFEDSTGQYALSLKVFAKDGKEPAELNSTYEIAENIAIDSSAKDLAPPLPPQATKNGATIEILCQDMGTNYQFKIEAYKPGAAGGRFTNTVQHTATSGIKGVYVQETASPQSPPAGAAVALLKTQDNQPITYTIKNPAHFVHVQAVDNAGNVGKAAVVGQ